MDEYIFEEINTRNNEIQRLKAESIQAGFMENRYPTATYPFQPGFTSYNPNVTQLYDRILEKVTGVELTILCRTRYNSPKAQILEYVRILERLIEEGVFDDPVIPQYQQTWKDVAIRNWDSGSGATCETPVETKTEETEKDEVTEKTKTEKTVNYEEIKKALGVLSKACDETCTTIITAIQKAVSDEDK